MSSRSLAPTGRLSGWRFPWTAATKMGYEATTGGISGALIRDLMVQSLEARFGPSNRLPHPIEWLSDNGSCYTAKEIREFSKIVGLVVCTTPVRSP